MPSYVHLFYQSRPNLSRGIPSNASSSLDYCVIFWTLRGKKFLKNLKTAFDQGLPFPGNTHWDDEFDPVLKDCTYIVDGKIENNDYSTDRFTDTQRKRLSILLKYTRDLNCHFGRHRAKWVCGQTLPLFLSFQFFFYKICLPFVFVY